MLIDNAEVFHGGVTGKRRLQAKENYNKGSAKMIIATQAVADTGSSFHDEVGDAPRTQINVTIPWTGIQMKQLAGRSHRLTSKSDSRMIWMFSNVQDEDQRAKIVAKKMEIVGASSKGINVEDNDEIYDQLMAFDMASIVGDSKASGMKKSVLFHVIKLK